MVEMRRMAWVPVVLLTGMGCGQSGTEGTLSLPENCVCDALVGDVALRAEVLSTSPTTLEVLEIFGDLPPDIVATGEHIAGSFTATLPCGDATGEEHQPGDEVLVMWQRNLLDQYPHCAAYQTCTAKQCGPEPEEQADEGQRAQWDACDEQCVLDTRASCEQMRDQALAQSTGIILAWSDPLVFGTTSQEAVTASPDALRHLAMPFEACEAAFPQGTPSP